jgi:hypothetical protein
MEPLWSPVDATGGNQRQIARTRKGQKQAKTLATACHRLRATFHGKEGVDGSSPSEGLKVLHTGTSCCLFRHDAGELYGGGQRGGDLQALRVFAAPIDRPRGNFEGTRAATVGSYVSCSSS